MNKRKDIDWEAIRGSYRCGIPGNRLLADRHGISEGAIRARAKREGWQRDLAAACRAEIRRRLAMIPPPDPEPVPEPTPAKQRPLTAAEWLAKWFPPTAAEVRAEMLAMQREHMADFTARCRSWGEKRLYKDIDGNVLELGWNPPKRDRDRCGARTRAGGTCKAPAVWGKERCRMHGGLSCGPRTPEGKARSLAAAREGYRRWRAKQRAAAQAPE